MVSFCGRTCLQVWVPGSPPNVDPTEQWIAYGLIVDDDGDGVGDRRFGIDNVPMTAGGEREYRTWITDLHSGRTESAIGDSYGLGDFVLEGTSYPVDAAEPNGIPDCSAGSAQFRFAGGDIAGGGTFGVVPAPFSTQRPRLYCCSRCSMLTRELGKAEALPVARWRDYFQLNRPPAA